jgi:cytidylate kinase
LRESGKSFSAIARALGFDRATEAHRSFVRALGAREGDERRQLAKNEEARLDQLEQRIRERDAKDVTKLERRLQGVQKLREAIPK